MRSLTRRGTVAAVLAAVTAAGMLQFWGPETLAKPATAPPAVPWDRPVHGTVAGKALPKPSDAASKHLVRGRTPAASWPAAGTAQVTVPAPRTPASSPQQAPDRAGHLPVRLAPALGGQVSGTSGPVTARVAVLDHAVAQRAGVAGVLVTVARADGVTSAAPVSLTVDYTGFRDAYGGDWASRLRLVELPACAATTPTRASCRRVTPVPSTNDSTAGRVTGQVAATGSTAVYAVAAAPGGGTGDFTATSLAPAGSWQVSMQTGAFTWSYPMRVPQVPGGLEPDVSLSYSSNAVDGHVASTNNQPSWVGEGWDVWPGLVERSYKGCADDMGGTANNTTKTGDLCWATSNATVSLAGHSGELVGSDSAGWRLRDDDGSKVEHLTGSGNGAQGGEYWKITTTDGTQYWFGHDAAASSTWTVPVYGNNPGEPCHAATFAASSCPQAYRWNLDYVVDRHGDAMRYFYDAETNSYGANLAASTAAYVRGGTLARIEYGTRAGGSGQPPARVVFNSEDRCAPGADCGQHTAGSWPDVPWDQNCASACTGKYSPTFWSTRRLDSVQTQILSGSAYRTVDTWQLDQTFPAPGDGTSAALWLHGITHTGGSGGTAITLPEETFAGTAIANRINTPNDGLAPLDKYRVSGIDTESGGTIGVTYDGTDCSASAFPAPESNTSRCFPVVWTPPNDIQRNDWFVKTAVGQVTQVDRVGGNPSQVTSYTYEGGAAWAFNDNPLLPPSRQTWSGWRGYQKVLQVDGDPADTANPRSATEYLFLRGMNGDHLPSGTRSVTVTDSRGESWPDDPQLAGFGREKIVDNGVGGPVVSDEIDDPWQYGPTASTGTHRAYLVDVGKERTFTALAAGGWRTTETDTSYDSAGDKTQVNDLGDTSTGADDQCTRTTYAQNTGSWVLDLPGEVATVGVACTATPSYPRDAISDTRSSYDGGAFGAAPAAGDVTRTELATDYTQANPFTTQHVTTFDAYGRTLSDTDALGRRTVTAYSPASGLPTSTTETDPLGYTTTTTLDPAFNQATAVVDANNRRTDETYDALGRLTAVWQPGRSKAGGDGANQRFGYGLRTDGPGWISTATLKANGDYQTGYQLYDGLLRLRQTQEPGWDTGGHTAGRVLTDTVYDSRGLVAKTSGQYYDPSAAPGTGLLVLGPSGDNQLPSLTVNAYDGAGRKTAEIFKSLNVEKWRTTTAYGGDHTDVTPPAGDTPTSTYTDVDGHTTELRQYLGTTPTGAYRSTRYSYLPSGKLAGFTDPAGNTWRYTYDLLGDQTSVSDPDTGTVTAGYDADGEKVSATDARGQTVASTFDALGRKTGDYQGSTAGPRLAGWGYDLAGGLGLAASTTRYVNGNAYTTAIDGYDAAGRPTGTTVTIPATEGALAGSYHWTSSYLPDGSPASATEPALGDLPAETLSYGYDDLGLPASLDGSAKYTSQTRYTRYGELDQYQLGPDSAAAWQTFFRDEPTRRVNRALVSREQSAATVDDTYYAYDPAGNVAGIADLLTGAATDYQCFTYDALRELTQAWTTTATSCGQPGSAPGGPAPYWQTYGYDAAGNRTALVRHGIAGAGDTTSTYTYPAAGSARPHGVQSVTTTGPNGTSTGTYGYDAAGDTTAEPSPTGGPAQVLSWDVAGDLTAVTAGSATSGYVDGVNGDLLVSHDSTGATLYLPTGEVHVDPAGKKTGTRYYQYGGHTVAVRTGAGVSYLFGDDDQHGTSDLAISAGTLAVTKRRSDPFGNPRGPQPASWPGDHGFVDGVADPTTGLTRLGVRDYDPTTGRFLSPDPVTDPNNPQQLDAYGYADDNPTSMTDPDGNYLRECPDNDCRGIPLHNPQPRPDRDYVGEANARLRRLGCWYVMCWHAPRPRPLLLQMLTRPKLMCPGPYAQCRHSAPAPAKPKPPARPARPLIRCPGPGCWTNQPKPAPKRSSVTAYGSTCTTISIQLMIKFGEQTCVNNATGQVSHYTIVGVGVGAAISVEGSQETSVGNSNGVQAYGEASLDSPFGPEVGLSANSGKGGNAVGLSGGVGASEGVTASLGLMIPDNNSSLDHPHGEYCWPVPNAGIQC